MKLHGNSPKKKKDWFKSQQSELKVSKKKEKRPKKGHREGWAAQKKPTPQEDHPPFQGGPSQHQNALTPTYLDGNKHHQTNQGCSGHLLSADLEKKPQSLLGESLGYALEANLKEKPGKWQNGREDAVEGLSPGFLRKKKARPPPGAETHRVGQNRTFPSDKEGAAQ